MANIQLQLEDLLLISRGLTLEEKQEILQKLDTMEPEKKTKLKEILQKEFNAFQEMERSQLRMLQTLNQDLSAIAASVPITPL